ncbi:MAG: VTT domain-containing protein [Candidatus Nanopelagicales bacterium]|nr:VTT domain-containing protein [Candidatus Nanopelagicales bacterium]
MTPLLTAAVSVQALGPSWLNPEDLLTNLGDVAFWVVLGIIFAECGILLGFFLPGDSLLFITGLFIAQGTIHFNLGAAVVLLIIAAIAGNVTGYWIGMKSGPSLFKKPDSKLFRKEYVDKTHEFFDKYGARAIVMARFVPIVRTFITAVAGIGRMDFKRYFIFSAIGGILWAGGITVAGYYLGTNEWVSKNLDKVILLIIAISILPMIVEFIRHRRQRA